MAHYTAAVGNISIIYESNMILKKKERNKILLGSGCLRGNGAGSSFVQVRADFLIWQSWQAAVQRGRTLFLCRTSLWFTKSFSWACLLDSCSCWASAIAGCFNKLHIDTADNVSGETWMSAVHWRFAFLICSPHFTAVWKMIRSVVLFRIYNIYFNRGTPTGACFFKVSLAVFILLLFFLHKHKSQKWVKLSLSPF